MLILIEQKKRGWEMGNPRNIPGREHWMVYFMEKPIYKWMIFLGTPMTCWKPPHLARGKESLAIYPDFALFGIFG